MRAPEGGPLGRATAKQLSYLAARAGLPGLYCAFCGSAPEYPVEGVFCSRCGAPLAFRVRGGRGEGPGVWKYEGVLPAPAGGPRISLGEGSTPVIAARSIGDELGLELLIKHEGLNPTGSIADRGSAVLLSALAAAGYSEVVALGSGRFAASVAAYAARAGLGRSAATIRGASPLALEVARAYGASVSVHDDWRRAASEALPLARDGAAYLATPLDPLFFEGEKTALIELAEQAPRPPRAIFVPAGDGEGAIAAAKGLIDAAAAGLRLSGTRAFVAYVEGFGGLSPEHARRVGEAAEGFLSLVEVGRGEAMAAMRDLAVREGLLVDLESAAALAAARAAREGGELGDGELAAIVAAGSGTYEVELIARAEGAEEGAVSGLRLLILEELSKGASHGYRIWRRLRDRGVGATLSAVYAGLADLEEGGYVARLGGDGRRVNFAITAKGLRALRTA